MRQHIAGTGARYVSVQAIACPQARCKRIAPDGGPIEFDYGHLTLAAARWVVDRISFGLPPVRTVRR